MQNASNDMVWNWESTSNRATDYLNYAKQHQTSATASEPSESTNPGAPLLQGNALITYENQKQKKKCVGKKNGCEIMCDIKVVSARCNGTIGNSHALDPGMRNQHLYHVCSSGGTDFTIVHSASSV